MKDAHLDAHVVDAGTEFAACFRKFRPDVLHVCLEDRYVGLEDPPPEPARLVTLGSTNARRVPLNSEGEADDDTIVRPH